MNREAGNRLTDRKRAAIVEAAVCEFKSRGYYAGSMQRIAEMAEVSKRTLYKHFASKEALFEAIVEELMLRVDDLPLVKFDANRKIEDQLTELAKLEVDFLQTNAVQALARAGLSRLLAEPDVARQIDHDRFLKHIKQWIQQAKAAGKFKNMKDVDLATKQLAGILKEFAFWPPILHGTPPMSRQKRNKIVKESVELFLARYR